MKKFLFLSAALLLLLTASCSNDENNNEQKEPTQTVQFSFINEDFGEDETPTRTTETAKPQIVDLGDCEAEISVESEPAAKTRGALTPANGHYTIRAYQAGTLKGEMSGTFSGGTFTPDASSHKMLNLPYGTYDFVAFNDDVTVSGTNLTTTRDKAETARMGFATINITSPTPIKVLFTMKHVGCRLRTQFVCRKHIPNNITATLEQTAANVIPASVAYNPATKAYTATNGAMTAEANNSPASTEMEYLGSNFGRKYSYPSTSDYHYFLPTTESSKLKLTFVAGTVFWKPLAGTIPQLNTTLQMQTGKSYLVTIKLKPNYIYLMSDGTTGHFKETTFGGGSKTPIAVVVDETKHIAVALNDVGGNHLWAYGYSYQTNKVSTTTRPAKFGDYLSLENGYEETWDGNYTTALVTGEKVKGKRADFPAFKAAADYTPGVSVSGTMVGKKWYLPAMGEWGDMFVNLGFMKSYSSETNWGSTHWYGYLCSLAFTQVGGNFSTADAYWSSSEFENMTAGILIPGEVLIRWQAYTKSAGWLVRSFIRY